MKVPFDFDRFADLADEMVQMIPEKFFRRFNGDIRVLPEPCRDEQGFYILGEYFTDEFLGQWIAVYYGSFAACFRGEPPEVWKAELWTTLLHEIRHHLEDLAGIDDLVREDMAELAAWLRERS
ncbi:MAG: metallopeptidase family protein [Heliobacteriaceae bacterium]|nr:metallopeptidase family protein [Heliobacteriaceae bacterium]MDD4588229.1 metallopeptidase family protein [Heliobacteriaceae bacterium]